MGQLSIQIDIDTGKKEIKIKDNSGNEHNLKGISVVGGDFESGEFYIFAEGSASDVGWALAHGYKWSLMSKHPVGKYYKRIYLHFLQWIATFYGWTMGTEITGNDLLEKWTKEDIAKAVEESKTFKFN